MIMLLNCAPEKAYFTAITINVKHFFGFLGRHFGGVLKNLGGAILNLRVQSQLANNEVRVNPRSLAGNVIRILSEWLPIRGKWVFSSVYVNFKVKRQEEVRVISLPSSVSSTYPLTSAPTAAEEERSALPPLPSVGVDGQEQLQQKVECEKQLQGIPDFLRDVDAAERLVYMYKPPPRRLLPPSPS